VVDTTQGLRFLRAYDSLRFEVGGLMDVLGRWTDSKQPMLGRTHGQPAELLTMEARARAWSANLGVALDDLARDTKRMQVCKLSGPVGTFAHNPPEVELGVAAALGLRAHGAGASQIAARAPLAAWANSAAEVVAVCAKIAMDIRLMNLLNVARVRLDDGQVGSSSMAHKRNPIRAEQVTGLQHLARGYAQMLQPLDGWLERDISQSCVERVAVPDLWHILLRAINQTTGLLLDLDIDERAVNNEIRSSFGPLVMAKTLDLITKNYDVDEARSLAMQPTDVRAQPDDAALFMRHYPRER
jgi:adenylosuccinate lyase